MPSNETQLIGDEAQLRNLIVKLLREDGHKTQTEVRLPGGFRVDILAEKEGVARAIEVKRESRGIADDIIKCQKLLRLPEVMEAYIAAPELIISPDHVAFAKSIGVGVICVTGSQLTWVVESWKMKEAGLTGYGSQPSHVTTGEIFQIEAGVRNQGQKIARGLEARCLPGGPFVFAPGSKRKYNRLSLGPGDSWSVQFLIRTKPSATIGEYPLFATITARNIPANDRVFNIKVETAKPKKM